jgi:NADPH-ferrihemoprotein reductase
LSKYALDPNQKELLYSISENREKFLSFIETEQKTLSCILEDFPLVKLPIEVALNEILRPISVRYYSISSSSLETPNTVSITAVVVRYALAQTRGSDGTSRVVLKEGLATSYLERMHDNEETAAALPPLHCPIYIRSSAFNLPKDITLPVVMVGPGTGVAPFRGFIRERFLLARNGEPVGPTWLFFGCRNASSVTIILI